MVTAAPSVADIDWPVSHRIIRTIYPPIWLFEDIADPAATAAHVDHAYVEDVKLGKRRLRVYVTLYRGLIEKIELQPIDSDSLPDLFADLVRMYGRPTHHAALITSWEGKRARLTWTQFYGATIVTLTSRRLEREMNSH